MASTLPKSTTPVAAADPAPLIAAGPAPPRRGAEVGGWRGGAGAVSRTAAAGPGPGPGAAHGGGTGRQLRADGGRACEPRRRGERHAAGRVESGGA